MIIAVVLSVLLHFAMLAVLDELPVVAEPIRERPVEIQVHLRPEPEPQEAAPVAPSPKPSTSARRSKPLRRPKTPPAPESETQVERALPTAPALPLEPAMPEPGVSIPAPAARGSAPSTSQAVLPPTPERGGPATRRSPEPLAGNPRPEYPRSARRFGWEGTVVLVLEVLADGTVGGVEIKGSSGYRELDRAAAAAARRWRFAPALEGGRPVPGKVEIPFVFTLK